MDAILALLTAILAAIITQIISHRLAKKREDMSEVRKAYQLYVAPLLSDVVLFYETETAFRSEHDVERNIDKIHLIKEIEDKISYASPYTMQAFMDYKDSITFFDGQGFRADTNTYRLFFWYLNDVRDIISKMNMTNEKIIPKIEDIQKKYAIWSIITEEFGNEDSTQILRYQWVWSEEFLSKWNLTTLKNLLEIDYFPKTPYHNLFCSIETEFLINQEKDEYQDIINLLKSNNLCADLCHK